MHRLLQLLLVLISLNASAQVEWVQVVGSAGADNIEKHILDPEGNVVAVGYFGGDVTIGNIPLTFTAGTDIFLFKATAQGEVLWAKSFHGPSWGGDCSLATDAQGNIYVAGGFVKDLIFEGRKLLEGSSRWNSFVCKFDPQGNLVWIKGIVGTSDLSGDARVMGNISVNAAGQIAVAGNFSGTISISGTTITSGQGSGGNFFIAKLSSEGDLFWVKTPNSQTNVEPQGIKIDWGGKVYVAGSYTNSVHFGSYVLTASNNSHSDLFLVKFEEDGLVSWAKGINKVQAGYQLNHWAGLVELDEGTGSVYMAGAFRYDIKVDGVLVESFGRSWSDDNNTGADILLAKFSANGALSWAKRIGSAAGHDYPCDLLIDEQGHGVLAGAGGANIGAPFFRHFDADGNLGEEKVFLSGGAITAVTPTANREYYISQRFWHKLFLDRFEIAEKTNGAESGEGDGVVFKISVCGSDTNLPVAPELVSECRKISIVNKPGAYSIRWYKDSQPIINQTEETLDTQTGGIYQASFTNGCGTTYSQKVIQEEGKRKHVVYNVITPNADGDNDVLVLHESLAGSAMKVYNRWGKEVYSSVSYQNNWDGATLPVGTYYYVIMNSCIGRISSSLTILR